MPKIWNVPFHNDDFTGRTTELNEIVKRFSETNDRSLTVCICGLPGMGKTQIAKEFAHRNQHKYEVVWWINAETQLQENYLELADALKINANGLDFFQIVKEVKKELRKMPNWLLIFDNLEKIDNFKELYLPEQHTSTAGHILITTRHRNFWPLAQSMVLGPFEFEEAKEYLLKGTNQEETADAKELLKRLGYFPLALSHAIAYINAHDSTISRYLKFYIDKQPIIFDFQSSDGASVYTDDYVRTVRATFELSYEKIKNHKDAANLMFFCSFISPDNIPEFLLESFLLNKVAIFELAIETLVKYALIQRDRIPKSKYGSFQPKDSYSIHRLVQEFIVEQIPEEQKPDSLNAAFQLIKSHFQPIRTNEHLWMQAAKLIAHLDSVLNWSDKYMLPDQLQLRASILSVLSYADKQDLIDIAGSNFARLKKRYIPKLDSQNAEDVNFYASYLDIWVGVCVNKRATSEEFMEVIQAIQKTFATNYWQILGADSMVAYELNFSLSNALLEGERYREAEILMNDALLQAIKRGDAQRQLDCYCNLGTIFIGQEQYSTALEHFKSALLLHEEEGRRFSDMGYVYNSMAFLYRKRKFNHYNLEIAKQHCLKSIEESDRKDLIGPEKGDRYAGWAFYHLARIYCKEGDYQQAKLYCDQFKNRINKIFPEQWPVSYLKELDKLQAKIERILPQRKDNETFISDPMASPKKFNTIENQVVLFNRNLSNVMVALRQQMAEIIARPAEFGLQPNGLSVALIRAQQEKKNESVLVKEIKKISTKALSLALKETFKSENNVFNGFNVLHWGMMLNRSEVVQYLLSKGFEGQLIQKNEFGLTPMQMAVVAGSRTCFMSRFASIPEFSEMDIQYINEQDEKLKFTLNELHLALMSQQVDIVRDIFATLKNRHKNIQTEIKGIGNLLHLLVYVGNSQAQQTLVNVDVESMNNSLDVKVSAVDLLQLILQQGFSKKILIKLLTEATNNHEGYSPLSLAAKYGQIGLLHALIRYLKIHVTESNGLEEVTKAFYVAAQHGQNETVEFLIHFYQFKPSNTHSYYEITLETLKEKSKAEPHYQLILGLIRKTEKETGHQQYIVPMPNKQTYENLVLSGGGGKGFIYPYALQALETCLQRRSESAANDFVAQSLGMNTVVRIAGTSAGAMFAFVLALGYTPKELEAKLSTNFAEFLEIDQLEQVTQQLQSENPNNNQILTAVLSQLNLQVEKLRALVGNAKESSYPFLESTFEFIKHPIALYNEVAAALVELKKLNQQFNGFSKGEKAYAFLKQLLLDKELSENLTFGELAQYIGQDANKQKGYKHLHVAVTNLTQSLFEVLSSENPLYKNYLILDAVRASMSYQLVFMPHHLRIKEGNQVKVLSDEYIDGGALRNYPIDEFDFKQYTDTDHTGDPKYPELNKKTLGFRFADHPSTAQSQKQPKSETLLSRFMEFVSLYSQAEALISAHIDREYHRSIVLDTGTIATFTFKQLTEAEKRFLKQQADLAVGEYFKTALHQGEIIVPNTLYNQSLPNHTSSQAISLIQSVTHPAVPNLRFDGSHESEFEAFQKQYFQEVNDKRLARQLTQEAAIKQSPSTSENSGIFFDPFQSFATEVESIIPDVSPSHIKKTTITPPLDTYSLIQTPQIVIPLSSGSTLNLAQTQTKKYLLQELLAIKNKYGEPLTLPRLHLQHAVRLAFKNFLVDKLMPFLKEHNLYSVTQPKSIFISYAWAIEGSSTYDQDKIYEGYIEKIAKDLERIGCKVYLDRWFDQPGNVLTEFLELMGKSDFFIPIGTHLYLNKYEKRAVLEKQREHVVRTEGQMLNYIASYSSQWQNTIMPILLEGTAEETLPYLLRPQLPLALDKEDYFDKFFALIKKIYGIDNRNKEFEKLVKGFYQIIKALPVQSETDLEQHIQTMKRNGSPIHRETSNNLSNVALSSASFVASTLATLRLERRNTSDLQQSQEKKETVTVAPILSSILKAYYQQPEHAQLKRLLYEATYPIVDNFVNLVIIQESEKKQTEESLKTDQYQDRRVNSFEDIHEPKKPIQLKAIFDKQKADETAPKHIIIEGRAGIGKTTLCQYIAAQWAADDGHLVGWRTQFELIVWLPLRQIAVDPKIDFESCTLSELIYKYFLSQKQKRKYDKNNIEAEIKNSFENQKMLLILDGYNEIELMLKTNKAFAKFVEEELLACPYWLLTSRAYYTNFLKSDRRLENVGFISEDIFLYVKKFFEKIQQESLVDQSQKTQALLSLIQGNSSIRAIAHTPVHLELICSVWEQDKAILENSLSMTVLYDRMVLNLLRRYLHKFQNKPLHEATLLEWPDILQIPLCQQILSFLEALAWDAMQKPDVILSVTTIKTLALQHFSGLYQRLELAQAIFKDLGLLKAFGIHATSPLDQDHYFIHLTFQEYFAARYFLVHWEEQIQATEILNKNIQDKRYQIVWWFVARFLGLQPNKYAEIVRIFFELLTNQINETSKYDLLFLTLCCWNESGLVNLPSELIEKWINPYLITAYKFDSLFNYINENEQLSKKIIQSCLQLLRNENSQTRYLTANTLGKLNVKNESVVEGLLSLLQDKDKWCRRAAIDALRDLRVKTGPVIQVFLDLLHDNDNWVRCSAANILVELEIKNEIVLRCYLELLQDEDNWIRRSAVDALGKLNIKTESVVQGLLGLLQDQDNSISGIAAGTLVKLGVKTDLVMQTLSRLQQTQKKEVHRSTTNALTQSYQGETIVLGTSQNFFSGALNTTPLSSLQELSDSQTSTSSSLLKTRSQQELLSEIAEKERQTNLINEQLEQARRLYEKLEQELREAKATSMP